MEENIALVCEEKARAMGAGGRTEVATRLPTAGKAAYENAPYAVKLSALWKTTSALRSGTVALVDAA